MIKCWFASFLTLAGQLGLIVLSTSPHSNELSQAAGKGGENPAVQDQRRVASIELANQQLTQLQQQLNRLQRTLRMTIEAEIAALQGLSFGSLSANQAVVAMIQEMLEAHGLRVRCPDCGHPAILRCSGRPGVASGVFVLDHTIEGQRTFHGGGSTLPEMRLIAKPRRRSANKAS